MVDVVRKDFLAKLIVIVTEQRTTGLQQCIRVTERDLADDIGHEYDSFLDAAKV